jgi:hypothetical protein
LRRDALTVCRYARVAVDQGLLSSASISAATTASRVGRSL